MKMSIVIPVYGCPGAVKPLCERLCNVIESITDDYEIIMVNDACPKNSWEEIQKACNINKKIIGLNLAKNFGQAKAITAGIDYCSGDWVVVMDCDLQDKPESILTLYEKAQEGYDVVFAKRKERKDSWLTKKLSKLFCKVYGYFSDDRYDPDTCNFSIARKKVIDKYKCIREQNRTYAAFIRWIGFRQTSIYLQADHRYEGKSSYSFRKKVLLAFGTIVCQSNKPLIISITFGFIISLIALLFIVYIILRALISGDMLLGWASTIASIYLMGGFILVSIGIVGIYIGNIFNEVKKRPIYIVAEEINTKGHSNNE